MTLKESLVKQFNYCNAIASDIIANGKSKEIQEYAKQFAEIENPLVGETDTAMYRGFILRECNDGVSYDILHKNFDDNGEHLIAIVGSYKKAKQWVDKWYRKYR